MARFGPRDGQIGEAIGTDPDLHQMHQRGFEGAVSSTGQCPQPAAIRFRKVK